MTRRYLIIFLVLVICTLLCMLFIGWTFDLAAFHQNWVSPLIGALGSIIGGIIGGIVAYIVARLQVRSIQESGRNERAREFISHAQIFRADLKILNKVFSAIVGTGDIDVAIVRECDFDTTWKLFRTYAVDSLNFDQYVKCTDFVSALRTVLGLEDISVDDVRKTQDKCLNLISMMDAIIGSLKR